ncbi:DUF721 family protein [Rhodococcus aerolatus]
MTGDTTGADGEPLRGVDLARRALEQARSAAQARGQAVGRGGASPRRPLRTGRRRRGWSGPGADDRDPQLFSQVAASLVRRRGWSEQVAAGAVLGRWESIVGPEVAAHARPVSLTDHVLVLAAESTAWATQLRTMRREILARIEAGVGRGVVTSVTVTGPSGPSWRFGERHVRGRGPRDTYG